jgi:hypothetical protein
MRLIKLKKTYGPQNGPMKLAKFRQEILGFRLHSHSEFLQSPIGQSPHWEFGDEQNVPTRQLGHIHAEW